MTTCTICGVAVYGHEDSANIVCDFCRDANMAGNSLDYIPASEPAREPDPTALFFQAVASIAANPREWSPTQGGLPLTSC